MWVLQDGVSWQLVMLNWNGPQFVVFHMLPESEIPTLTSLHYRMRIQLSGTYTISQ
jgi:hypothetical protein